MAFCRRLRSPLTCTGRNRPSEPGKGPQEVGVVKFDRQQDRGRDDLARLLSGESMTIMLMLSSSSYRRITSAIYWSSTCTKKFTPRKCSDGGGGGRGRGARGR